jgi:O-antigen ligase
VLGVLSFQEPLRYPRALLVPALVIVGAAGVSVFAAAYMGTAALQVVRYVEVFLVLFLVVYMTANTSDVIHLLITAILLAGLVAAWVGLVQFVTGEGTTRATRKVPGFLGGGYGAAMAVELFLALSVLIHPSPRRTKIAAGIVLPFVAVALFLSQARAWMGAFVVALLVSMLFARKEVRRMMLVAFAVIVGGVALLIATNAFGLAEGSLVDVVVRSSFRWQTTRGSAATEEISLLMRLNAWSHALALFVQHPLFGIGVGNLRIADYVTFTLARPMPDAGYIDNQTIQIFAEAGLFAGVAWLLFVINALKIGWSAVRRAARSNLAGPMHGLFGALVIFFLGSNFWVITPSHELFALLIIVIALLAAGTRIQHVPSGPEGVSP